MDTVFSPTILVCFVAWTKIEASTVKLTLIALLKCWVPVSQGRC